MIEVESIKSALDLARLQQQIRQRRARYRSSISVCGGTGCRAASCLKIRDAISEELAARKLCDTVNLVVTGCHGFCEQGPIVVIRPNNIFYPKVKLKDVPRIIAKSVMEGEPIMELLYRDPITQKSIPCEDDIPFYRQQKRVIFAQNGHISPTNITDYIATGGYSAISKALFEMTPSEIIEEISASELRGRGGGGFATGRKWALCRKSKNPIKYLICNGDEGDPGAFMDRSLLEGNPHAVIEGMLLGAYAIGAEEGFIYVRHEYPLAIKHLETALQAAKEAGLLGDRIMGSNFSFTITPSRGGGAFVCGESTALIASLEGRYPQPSAKYIHTTERGFHRAPTVLNNVETWANVPIIIAKGAANYRRCGSEGNTGTKIFSLVGKINNTGLVEVPMGITLRDIIFKIGAGIPNGKKFKAVQTGGPSGGCLPASQLDLPVDFTALKEAGSMMGSGGMIVMDEDTCMVDVAKYFVEFLYNESCGKCTPCREGLTTALALLKGITEGKGKIEDLEFLEEIAGWLEASSLCALGGSAAYPFISTIKYFRHEYEAHINEGRCEAGVCSALITYSIAPKECNGCGACMKVCPSSAIVGAKKQPHGIEAQACTKCGACIEVCKPKAIIRR